MQHESKFKCFQKFIAVYSNKRQTYSYCHQSLKNLIFFCWNRTMEYNWWIFRLHQFRWTLFLFYSFFFFDYFHLGYHAMLLISSKCKDYKEKIDEIYLIFNVQNETKKKKMGFWNWALHRNDISSKLSENYIKHKVYHETWEIESSRENFINNFATLT